MWWTSQYWSMLNVDNGLAESLEAILRQERQAVLYSWRTMRGTSQHTNITQLYSRSTHRTIHIGNSQFQINLDSFHLKKNHIDGYARYVRHLTLLVSFLCRGFIKCDLLKCIYLCLDSNLVLSVLSALMTDWRDWREREERAVPCRQSVSQSSPQLLPAWPALPSLLTTGSCWLCYKHWSSCQLQGERFLPPHLPTLIAWLLSSVSLN